MLDRDGYRPNVGIILINSRNEVFWGKRIREHSWQFPQGGIKRGESPEQAMFRELHEEVGLLPEQVRIIGRTREWLRYDVPLNWVRREWRGSYRGQKQIWFLLRLVGRDTDIDLRATGHPEFDAWRWSCFWVPLEAVIEFKREVYRLALMELSRLLPPTRPMRDTERTRFMTPRFLRGHRVQPHAPSEDRAMEPGIATAERVATAPDVAALAGSVRGAGTVAGSAAGAVAGSPAGAAADAAPATVTSAATTSAPGIAVIKTVNVTTKPRS